MSKSGRSASTSAKRNETWLRSSNVPKTEQLTDAQRRRAEAHAPRVASLARALASRMSHASIDELQSAGYEGLVQAALRYDPESGVPFGAFAHYRIRGAMVDFARRASPAIRRRSRALRALETSQALLEQANRGMPPSGEIDPRTLRERVAAAADIVAQTTAAVVLAKAAPEDPDAVADGTHDAEEAVLANELREQLRIVLRGCDEEERALIDALYTRGLTMGEYAKQLGKNKSTISRQHARMLDRLGKRMRAPPQRKPPDTG